MNKINLLRYNWLAVIIILIFTQCDDIEKEIGDEADLIGTWILNSAEARFISGNSSLEEDLKENGFSNEEIKVIINDLEDEFIIEDYIIRFSQENVFLVREEGSMEEKGTWELFDDRIVIKDFSKQHTSEFKIINMNARELRLVITDTKLLEIEKDFDSILFGNIESEVDYSFTKAFE